MSLWNGFQKNAKKATKKGIKQTSKWAKLGKLNVELNVANLELQRLFEQIGEYIYERQLKDLTGAKEVQELLHQATIKKRKIKSIQARIHAVKKVNVCENCYRGIDPGTKYCPYCSHPQSKYIKITANE